MFHLNNAGAAVMKDGLKLDRYVIVIKVLTSVGAQ